MEDLTNFVSPLSGEGKSSLLDFCEKHDLDFDESYKKLSTWFDTFPAKIHVSANIRHSCKSWWEWLNLCPK